MPFHYLRTLPSTFWTTLLGMLTWVLRSYIFRTWTVNSTSYLYSKGSSLKMGLHPDSTGNVLAPKLELEASDFSSSDSLLESGESSHHLPSISKYYQNLTSSQPFLVGWISATVICLLVMFILVAFFMPMVLYPTDQVCSAKLSMYCKFPYS